MSERSISNATAPPWEKPATTTRSLGTPAVISACTSSSMYLCCQRASISCGMLGSAALRPNHNSLPPPAGALRGGQLCVVTGAQHAHLLTGWAYQSPFISVHIFTLFPCTRRDLWCPCERPVINSALIVSCYNTSAMLSQHFALYHWC